MLSLYFNFLYPISNVSVIVCIYILDKINIGLDRHKIRKMRNIKTIKMFTLDNVLSHKLFCACFF